MLISGRYQRGLAVKLVKRANERYAVANPPSWSERATRKVRNIGIYIKSIFSQRSKKPLRVSSTFLDGLIKIYDIDPITATNLRISARALISRSLPMDYGTWILRSHGRIRFA